MDQRLIAQISFRICFVIFVVLIPAASVGVLGYRGSLKWHIRGLTNASLFLLYFYRTREAGISLDKYMQGENDSTSMPRGHGDPLL